MKQQKSRGDPRYQPTEKAPKGTTTTKPLPRQGGVNGPLDRSKQGGKK